MLDEHVGHLREGDRAAAGAHGEIERQLVEDPARVEVAQSRGGVGSGPSGVSIVATIPATKLSLSKSQIEPWVASAEAGRYSGGEVGGVERDVLEYLVHERAEPRSPGKLGHGQFDRLAGERSARVFLVGAVSSSARSGPLGGVGVGQWMLGRQRRERRPLPCVIEWAFEPGPVEGHGVAFGGS